MKEDQDLVELGFCTKPHGIKGGFTFTLENMEDSVLNTLKTITIFPKSKDSCINPKGELFTISKISFGNKVIAYLEGISDRNRVEELIPFTIKVPRSSFQEIDDDEFYIVDVIGCRVFEHGTGKELGVVNDYYDNGMQIIFTIQGRNGYFDVPFVESFVPVVDTEHKRIEIIVPEVIE